MKRRHEIMTRWAPFAGLACAMALAPGCGEPLRDAAFVGEPLAVFVAVPDGPEDSGDTLDPQTRVALMWSIEGDTRFLQQPGPSPRLVDGEEVRLALYAPPPARARAHGYAVGLLVPYIDADDDGRLDEDEARRNPPSPLRIFWSPDGLGPETGPVTLPIPAGYVAVRGYLPCAGPFLRSEARPACGFELEATCVVGGDCVGSNLCVRNISSPEALGYCAHYDTFDGACAPDDARRVPYDGGRDYWWAWERACEADADCPEGLLCGRGSGTCVPGFGVLRILYGPMQTTIAACIDSRASYYRGPPGAGGPPPERR